MAATSRKKKRRPSPDGKRSGVKSVSPSQRSRGPLLRLSVIVAGYLVAGALLAWFVWWFHAEGGGHYWMGSDSARYMQIAMQLVRDGKLAMPPELGLGAGVIYPPLQPILIAGISLFLKDFYLSSQILVFAMLLLAPATVALLTRSAGCSHFAALFTGAAAGLYLTPQYGRSGLTEPLHVFLCAAAFLAFVVFTRRGSLASGERWLHVLGFVCLLAALARQQGLLLMPAFAAGAVWQRPAWASRRLLLIGAGWWLAAVITTLGYSSYLTSTGALPQELLLHAHSRDLQGLDDIALATKLDLNLFRRTIAPERDSLLAYYRLNPAIYWQTIQQAALAVLRMPATGILLVILIRLIRRRRAGASHLPETSLIAFFFMNAALIVAVGQHPNYVIRMFDSWLMCAAGFAVLEIHDWLSGLSATPRARLAGACLLVAISASASGWLLNWVQEWSRKPRAAALPAPLIELIQKHVPEREIILTSSKGGPEIASAAAGRLNMVLLGPPETYLRQAARYRIRYILWPEHIPLDYDAALPGCEMVFSYPDQRLYDCAAVLSK